MGRRGGGGGEKKKIKKILWMDLFRGPVGGVKNKNSINFFFIAFAQLGLRKVKKFEGPSYHGS